MLCRCWTEKRKAEKVKETIQMAIVKRYPNNAGALALARAVTVKYNIFLYRSCFE